MTTTMDLKSFEATMEKEGIVLVDFWASWCAPCRAFAPVFEAASQRHDDLTWAKVDTDAQQELASGLGIRAIPTLMVFRDGVLVFERAGVMPAAALDDLVKQVRALDMAKVRTDVERQNAEHAAAVAEE